MIPFLLKALGISLSGVMAPGPVTAATLAAGARNRHAGFLIAVGHGIVEFPLMLLIMTGARTWLTHHWFQIGVGLIGGAFLLSMGVQMLRAFARPVGEATVADGRHPIWIGIILTAGNPYFLAWWASAGLALTVEAVNLGPMAFAVFAVMHWLCDCIWLECLSLAGFHGSRIFSERTQRYVLLICGLFLVFVGGSFVLDAVRAR